ncbi:MAG: RNA-splicing ligase RtcB [Deltaproteobacteria bacterium RIFOXYD12_FULL_57_12]|nr:MAG: RNA-splicing ligase RtcB [Deltaproteobacteria bacterium RIFOXYD12_FULL_57_12]
MNLDLFTRHSEYEWEIAPRGAMRVPARIFGSEELIREMDQKVYEQVTNVATLPGIVKAAYAMPDAHWGYGFPIGGVAAFDPDQGGVVSAGGVGFDISCGVRTILLNLTVDDILAHQKELAEMLACTIPAGVGSTGKLRLGSGEMDDMLAGGARWAVGRGYGSKQDLERIEEQGMIADARPDEVSAQAKKRQRDEMGTLGSGNHYLEIQQVADVYDAATAELYGLRLGDVVLSIHCGSRGLGHQIGTEFLKEMAKSAGRYGLVLPDRELACSPINSPHGQSYLGAMRAAINCALANRQILTHLTRQVFERLLPRARLELLYDVSHNTCKVEEHQVDGRPQRLYIHRKGATRAYGPGHPDIPIELRQAGQPVLIGGTMGTESYILAGSRGSEAKAFSSACHGAGRSMSRRTASKRYRGRQVIDELAGRGILIRSPSSRGVAEEAPGAYKDVSAVVEATEAAGLARKVARVEPLVCIKG